MTHEELLAKIDKKHWHLFNFNYQDQSLDAIEFRKAVLKNTQTLKTIAKLHKPDEYNTCNECTRAISPSIAYPCPTIQAIEKELK